MGTEKKCGEIGNNKLDAKSNFRVNIHTSARLYRELLEETRVLAHTCFEQEFVNKDIFEGIVFMEVAFCKGVLTKANMEETLRILDLDEDGLLETIQILFSIHDHTIPEELFAVIQTLSDLLPMEPDSEPESLEGMVTPKEAYVTVFESLEIGQTQKDPVKVQIRFLEQLLLENPLNLHIQYLLAKKYMETHQLSPARKILRRLRSISPEDVDVLYDLGVIEILEGQMDRAWKYFQKVLRINPQFEMALLGCAEVLMQLKRYQMGATYLCRYIRKDGRNSRAWELLGLSCVMQHLPGIADLCFDNAIKYGGDNSKLLFRIGILQVMQKRYKDAIEFFKKISENELLLLF